MWQRMGTIAAGLLAALQGCGGYSIEGMVIEGSFTDARIVASDDSATVEPALRGTRVSIVRDPDHMHPHMVGEATSSAEGRFRLDIGEFGAGWMEEQWLIRATKQGYRPAEQLIRLPSSAEGMLLLITLEPGAGGPMPTRENLMEEFERYR